MDESRSGAPAVAGSTPESGRQQAGRRVAVVLSQYGTLLGLLAMVVAFSIGAPAAFPSAANLLNVLNQVSLTAIVAGGVTLPLAVGEFDMSIGYGASFAGILVTGLMANQHLPVPLAVLVAVLFGALVGVANGLIVTKLGVNALIATLGTGTLLIGLEYAYSAGIPIATGIPHAFLNITLGSIVGIPNGIWIMAAVLSVLWLLLNYTEFGQQVQAIGGNVEAARLSGIRVDRVKILTFVISDACAALTGVLLASVIGSGQTSAGDSYLLSSFAACFLGTTTLRDGEFHIAGTLVGVLIIGVAFNGLAIFGAPTFFQYLLNGAILVVAVTLGSVARRYVRG